MFQFIGAVVVYGFAIYGLAKSLATRFGSGADAVKQRQ